MKYIVMLSLVIANALTLSVLHAQPLRIKVTKGQVAPHPIAVPDFGGNTQYGKKLAEVVRNNLKSSALFDTIDARAFIQKIKGVDATPRFGDWRKIDAQSLVTASVLNVAGGKLQVKFRLWDIFSGKQVLGKEFTANARDWRRLAHKASDVIYSRLTGEGAYFDSRIVYIAETGGWKKRVKRLAIMDQDGANHMYLTSGKYLELTPRFDPQSQRLIYMAYYGRKPRVYLYDLQTGKEKMIGSFKGMTFAPRFSPDGKKAILSASENGKSKIYEINLKTNKRRQLTWGSAIDTSPSYSPDGKKIVFNSDRGGRQQIYVIDSNGKNLKRVSFGDGTYATPVWSPRGDLVAFTRMYKGKFYIGVMKPDGSAERLLTESYLDESPSWSPNGRVIMFTRQTRGTSTAQGKTHLYSIDLTGYNERKIKTITEASDPAWSPIL
jgi:TolB protein